MTDLAQMERVELRCPNSPNKLLGAMRSAGEQIHVVNNLWELPCRDCRQEVASKTGKKPIRVLHYFNIAGICVDSEIVWSR